MRNKEKYTGGTCRMLSRTTLYLLRKKALVVKSPGPRRGSRLLPIRWAMGGQTHCKWKGIKHMETTFDSVPLIPFQPLQWSHPTIAPHTSPHCFQSWWWLHHVMGMLVIGKDYGFFGVDKKKQNRPKHRQNPTGKPCSVCFPADKFTFQHDNNLKHKAKFSCLPRCSGVWYCGKNTLKYYLQLKSEVYIHLG